MAGDKLPSLQALEKPEKLQDLLKADRGEDCTPCKVVGTSDPSPEGARVGGKTGRELLLLPS